MKLGVINQETWLFLQDIYDYLASQYPTQIFKAATWPFPIMQPRMSHYLLRRSLKRFLHECDVVFFEWASGLVAEATSMKAPAAIVTRLHRYEMFQWTDKINWDAVNYVILDTQAMRTKLLSRTNLAPHRAVVIPPIGLTKERLRLSATPVQRTRPFRGHIGILCNLVPRKRVYELIFAFYALLKEVPELQLHIGGGARPNHRAYYEAIFDLIGQLGLEDKVTFHGRVEERWKWYQTIDIFVSFSYSEGMQVAPLEAAASGCYCISHGWAGADEIFPKEQLFLTEEEFVRQALRYCHATEEERQRMREPLLAFVTKNCNLRQVSTAIQEVIEMAAKEQNRGSSHTIR